MMETTNTINVLIVCTNSILRNGISKILAENPMIQMIGELSSGLETINKIHQVNPDIALVDYHLCELSGIEVARRIWKTTPKIKVVMFSSYPMVQEDITKALEVGVSAILDNSSVCDELMLAIKAGISGQLYLTPSISSKVFRNMNCQPNKKNGNNILCNNILSEREREVIHLIVEGLTSPQIADRLCISQKTVRNHRANLMNKLGLHGTAEIVKYAIKTNIVNISI